MRKWAFPNPAFAFGLPLLVEKAKEFGLAALVIQDCTHYSALWHETEAIAAHGLAGLAMCPSYATVAPFGGNAPLLGTNPLSFGWPRPEKDPYVFDFATSMAARGEIELYNRAGKSLPQGWGIDKDGKETTDPAAVLEGSMLPFGAHKGIGNFNHDRIARGRHDRRSDQPGSIGSSGYHNVGPSSWRIDIGA